MGGDANIPTRGDMSTWMGVDYWGQFYKQAVMKNTRSHFMCIWKGWRRKYHFRWTLNDASIFYQTWNDNNLLSDNLGDWKPKSSSTAVPLRAPVVGGSLPCLAQLPGLLAASLQCLPPLSYHHILRMSVIRTLFTGFNTATSDNPGGPPHLKVLSLITSEKTISFQKRYHL